MKDVFQSCPIAPIYGKIILSLISVYGQKVNLRMNLQVFQSVAIINIMVSTLFMSNSVHIIMAFLLHWAYLEFRV